VYVARVARHPDPPQDDEEFPEDLAQSNQKKGIA